MADAGDSGSRPAAMCVGLRAAIMVLAFHPAACGRSVYAGDAGPEEQDIALADVSTDEDRGEPDLGGVDVARTDDEGDETPPADDAESAFDSLAEDATDSPEEPEWCACGAGHCACLDEGEEVPAPFAGTGGEPGKLDAMLHPLLYCRTQEDVAAIAAELARALAGETDPFRIDALREEYARRFGYAVGWPIAMDAAPDGTPLAGVILRVAAADEAAEHVRCAGGRCHVPEPTFTILTASIPVRALATLTALPVIVHVEPSLPVEPVDG